MPSKFSKITRLGLPFMAAFACFLATFSTQKAQASHLLGGQITYVYLGSNGPGNTPFQFRVTFTAYVDGTCIPGTQQCSNFPFGNLSMPGGPNPIQPTLAFYDMFTHAQVATLVLPNQPHPQNAFIDSVIIPVPNSCTTDDTIQLLRFWKLQYTADVNLPIPVSDPNSDVLQGYDVLYGNRARSEIIKNLDNPGGTGLSIYARMASPFYSNSSPQFVGDATTFICLSDTATLANNARDPDGDRLLYNFATPLDYNGPNNGSPPTLFSPQPSIEFATGYSLTQPFGAGGVATLDASTGLARYHAARPGTYTVAYEILEYRTLLTGEEILLGRTRREIQIVVRECLPNTPPVGNGGSPTIPPTSTYTITEGESVTFNVGATDADTMILSATGAIFDSLYPNNVAVFPTVIGPGQVNSTFTWQTACGIRGTFPVNVQVRDKGCPPKTTNAIYNINVLPFRAPQSISGIDSVCGTGQTYTYTVTSTAPESQFSWHISGGAITSSGTGKTVTVTWDPAVGGIDAGQITIVQRSGSGCLDSTTRIIKVFDTPGVLVAPNFTLCQGDTTQIAASGGSGNFHWAALGGGPALSLSDTTIANPNAFPLDTTMYVVSSNNILGCPSRDTTSVNVVPDVANAGLDSSVCSGSSIVIGTDSVSGYSYSWTPANLLAGAGTASPVFTDTASGSPIDITLIVTATHVGSSCASQDSVTVRINVLPEVNAGPDTTFVCSRSSVVLGGQFDSTASYQWSPAANLSSDTVPHPEFSLTTGDTLAQVFKYIVTATAARTRCQNQDSTTVKVNPLPFIPLAVQDSICSGGSVQIGVPDRGYTYTWVNSDSLSTGSGSQTTFHYTLPEGATTSVDVVYVLRAVNPVTGCMDSSSIRIRVNPLPIVNAGADRAVCSGDTVSIGTGTSTGYAYTWSPGLFLADTFAAAQIIHPIYRPNPATGLGDTTINYTLGAVNRITGCSNNDAVSIRVKELPIVNALTPGVDTATTCSNAAVQIGTPDNTDLTYIWTGAASIANPDSAITDVFLVNADNFIPRIEQYVLAATSATTQCHNSDTIFVRVNPQPLVEVGSLDSLCSGQNIQIGAPSRPGYTYVWTPNQGLTDTSSSQPGLVLINGDTLPATGTYTLLVTNQYSCRDTGSITIRTNPLPPVPLGVPPSVCSKEQFTIGVPNGRTELSYTWSPLDGLTQFGRGDATGMIDNPTQHDSTRMYHLTTTNLRTRCSNSDSILVTIRPLPIAQAGPDSLAICSGDSARLGTGSTSQYAYTWTPALDLSSDTVSDPLATITSATGVVRQYRVDVLNRANGCSNADSISVRVNPLPLANAGIDKAVCVNDSIQLGGHEQVGLVYQWNPSQGLSDPDAAHTYFYATAADTLSFTVLVTNSSTNCHNADTVSVFVNPLPTAKAGPDVQVCSAAGIVVGDAPEPGMTYAWAPTTGLTDPATGNPTYTSENTTQDPRMDTLTVQATITATGCKATDSVIVAVNPRPIGATFAPFPATVCPGTQGQPYAVANPQTGYTYNWAVTPTGTLAGGNGTPSVTVDYLGPQNNVVISVLATNGFGCAQFRYDSILVTVNQLLVPTTPAPQSTLTQLCLNQARDTYSTLISPSSQYTWKYILNNGDTSTVSGAGNQVALSWLAAGSGEIWVEEIASPPPPFGQCFGRSQSLFIRIYQSPDTNAAIAFNPSICQFTSNSFELNGLDSSTYRWNVQPQVGGNAVIDIASGGPDSVGAQFDTAGIYLVTSFETSNHGCPGKERTAQFTVNPKPVVALAQAEYAVCPQQDHQTFSVANPDASGAYTWFVTGGSVTAQNAGDVEVGWIADAIKAVKVIEVSGAGCGSDTAYANIKEDKSALMIKYVTVDEADDSKVNVFYALNNGVNFPGQIEVWRADGTGQPSRITSQDTVALSYGDNPGNTATTQYTYNVKGTNLCGFELTSSVHKTIVLTVEGDETKAGPGTSHLTWTPYETFPEGIENYEVLRQLGNTGSFAPLEPNPLVAATESQVTYANAGDAFNQCYRVSAIANGTGYVSLSNKSCVTFKDATETYNVVTPNGDGKNDFIYVKNITLYPNANLRVYNRWGKLVAERNGYRNDWTPTDLSAGQYTFLLTGADKTIKGWFEVVK